MNYNNAINLYIVSETNAGDIFTKFLVENLIDVKSINYGMNPGENGQTDTFQIVGSLAGHCRSESIILGTGIMADMPMRTFKECHMVRGEITKKNISLCKPNFNTDNLIMGDPGLLITYFISNKSVEKKYEYGILLHCCDQELFKYYFSDDIKKRSDVLIIDILVLNNNFEDFSNNILSCKKILTSSLHGVVFSHSLNVPVSWISLSRSILQKEGTKFHDYLSIYNIDSSHSCKEISTKLDYEDLKNFQPIEIDQNFLKNKKKELLTKIVQVFRQYNYKIKSPFDKF